jgi:hypothetical protein
VVLVFVVPEEMHMKFDHETSYRENFEVGQFEDGNACDIFGRAGFVRRHERLNGGHSLKSMR